MPNRIHSLNIYVIIVIVFYNLFLQRLLLGIDGLNDFVRQSIIILSSIGVYRVLLMIVYASVSRSRFLLRVYWGKDYLDGLWSYTYTLANDDSDDKKMYFGVWCFDQDLYGTSMRGFGLTDSFEIRSRVSSVTDLIQEKGGVSIVNTRSDSIDPNSQFFSTTSMVFAKNPEQNFWGNYYPVKMRSKTIIYGGKLSGKIHEDVFSKHENAKTEDDVIQELKNRFLNIYTEDEVLESLTSDKEVS